MVHCRRVCDHPGLPAAEGHNKTFTSSGPWQIPGDVEFVRIMVVGGGNGGTGYHTGNYTNGGSGGNGVVYVEWD